MSSATLIAPTFIRPALNKAITSALRTTQHTRATSSSSSSSSSSSTGAKISPMTVMLYSYIAGSFTLPFVAPANLPLRMEMEMEKEKKQPYGQVPIHSTATTTAAAP
ncbi:hypothetical protein DFH27DRAFT_615260 [Peziza echinospora]|nr:hypothetical protein DFH27DRAFT_615260 [Peziza echinospora]